MKVRAERQRNGATPVTAGVKTIRVARQLKTFLEKKPGNRVPRQRQQPSSVSSEEILTPAVRFAMTRLRRTTPVGAARILARSAWHDLQQDLSARLAFALTPTLRLQQAAAKAVARSLPTDDNGKRRHASHGNVSLLETIIEFPDLLETAAQLISAWIDAQRELFARLLRDKADLCSSFSHPHEPFRVTHIRARLSDPHDGARTATLVVLGAVRRVFYKPRSASGEQVWFEALRWMNRNHFRLSFRIPTILARRDYFWMQFLGARDCVTSGAVNRLYFRWGAQVAIAELLAAIDLHRDNWLAVGSQPILVDAEFIGHRQLPSRGKRAGLDRQALPAILETGLLPLITRDRVGRYRGIAPLDATIANTGAPNCWPRYRGQFQPPSKYVNALVRGFEAVEEFFSRPQLARKFFADVILQRARDSQTRILLRSTAQYARLLRESLEARNMVSEGSRWRYLVRECSRSAPTRAIAFAEARALLRCDIPKLRKRRGTISTSWKQFAVAIAKLKSSRRLLRRRVLSGTRMGRS